MFALLRRGAHQLTLEQLPHYPEREVLLEFGRPSAQHTKSKLRRARCRDIEQPGLPQSGGTLYDHRSSGAPSGVLEGDVDLLDLALTLEQRGRRDEGGVHHSVPRS
jgi:hypothetical protein